MATKNEELAKGVGQGQAVNEVIQKIPGTYADAAQSIPEADRLQESNMPKGPDPSPFTLGPMTSGGR